VIHVGDFTAAFLTVAAIGALSALIFLTLTPDAGAELSGRAVATVTPDPLPERPAPENSIPNRAPPDRQAAE
jgi:hypothetical protein